VVLLVLVLSAAAQAESSNEGDASGDSAAVRHAALDRSGNVIGAAPASCVLARWLPAAVPEVATASPFQVIRCACTGAQISRSLAAAVSPVSARVEPLSVAVRTNSGPRTSTGPAEVCGCQNVPAVSSSASSSVDCGRSPPLIFTSASPLCV